MTRPWFPRLGSWPRAPREPNTTYHWCADERARRYNASSPEDTQDGAIAYARFVPSQPARYRDGLLPGS
jgi:hypothetical protein